MPGGPGDGETSWRFLLPMLGEKLTCYTMSPRGKGLSAEPDPPNYSRERLLGDVVAFVESIGEPVGLMAHSSGGAFALEAAARTEAISALALYEPNLIELADDEIIARYDDAGARARHAAEQGELSDAARIFFEDLALANADELGTMAAAGVYELLAPNIPVFFQEVDQAGLPHLSDMALLERVTIPALLLTGSQTHPHYRKIVRHLAERLADARVREITGAGHLGPQLAPQPVANELARFFAETPQSAVASPD